MKRSWSGYLRAFLREDSGLQLLEWSIVALGVAVAALAFFQAIASLSGP
jgi:hypothetical protein